MWWQQVARRFKLPKFVFGDVSFLIEGANFSALLNLLSKKGIMLKKVERQNAKTLFIVAKMKDCQNIVAILNKKCYTIKEQKANEALSVFKSFFSRIWLLVGIFVGVILNVLASFFVWDIKLVGDEKLSSKINQVLSQNGIFCGRTKFGLDGKEIENILLENVPNLSLVDVSTRGCTLNINYTTRTLQTINQENRQNILATSDGIIASISAVSGTPLVKVGDFVKKGQVLIAGYYENEETKTEVPAKGVVFAYSWKSATIEFPLEKIEWVRTGNFVAWQSITLYGKVLEEKEAKHNFKKFETETSFEYLLKSSPIPLVLKTTKIYEVKAQMVKQNFEDYKDKLFAQAKMVAWQQIGGDENILDEKTETNFVSNIWFVTHYIKIKEKIS